MDSSNGMCSPKTACSCCGSKVESLYVMATLVGEEMLYLARTVKWPCTVPTREKATSLTASPLASASPSSQLMTCCNSPRVSAPRRPRFVRVPPRMVTWEHSPTQRFCAVLFMFCFALDATHRGVQ
jgi:hypothetical protein